jgi:2,4-dienoyl-CoA reductase-like NADH-dependent reductase (Old Yellow Enzyme family)
VSTLFEATKLKDLTLRNRFVRSATWEGLAADDGTPTRALVDVSAALARGGVGLIITGHAFVAPEGRAGPWQLAAHDDGLIPQLREMTKAVHDFGGTMALQIAHAGLRAVTGREDLAPIGPSVFQAEDGPSGREMDSEDVERVVQAFAAAARRAREAGFDGVQIHAAHGYLLSEFLSPFFNQRTDAYGGVIQNRAKLLGEVLGAVRRAAGDDFPIFAKLNSEDFLPNGLSVDDMLVTVALLAEGGVDAVELSGGTYLSGDKKSMRQGKAQPGEPEAYYEAAATRYKQKFDVPLMLVGGIRTLETAERLVSEGVTDYVSLCRPLIREPDLVKRWESGDRRPAFCVSDNRCFVRGLKGRGVECVYRSREI